MTTFRFIQFGAAAGAAMLASAGMAGVMTTTSLDAQTVSPDGTVRTFAPDATVIDDINVSPDDVGTSLTNVGASVVRDDTGLISYTNYAGAAGAGVQSRSTTLISQRVTNETGGAVDVKLQPLIFGGGVGIFIPDLINFCNDGRLNSCAATNESIGIFDSGFEGGASVDFSVLVNGVEVFSLYTDLSLEGGSVFSDPSGQSFLNGVEFVPGYSQNFVLISWEDTLLDIDLGNLADGGVFDIQVISTVFASSENLCLEDDTNSCLAALATFSDPLNGGLIGGGGGLQFFTAGVDVSPRSLPDPQVFFREEGGDFVLQNPIGGGPTDVPAPAALALFGLGAFGLGLRRKRTA